MEINYYNKHIMLTNTSIALNKCLLFFIHSVIHSLIRSTNIYFITAMQQTIVQSRHRIDKTQKSLPS